MYIYGSYGTSVTNSNGAASVYSVQVTPQANETFDMWTRVGNRSITIDGIVLIIL